MMTDLRDIPHILSLARAGATSRAWDAFVDAGFDGVLADAKVLTLKGRLLKDKARAAQNGSQSRLFLQSAKAYADAAQGRYLVAGAHLPFPGIGHIRADGKGYAWVPVDYNTIR